MSEPVKRETVAWKDIEYYAEVMAHSHHMDVQVFRIHVHRAPNEPEWDGGAFAPKEAPPGYSFSSEDDIPVRRVSEARVFLSGAWKWDGCVNFRFDEQDQAAIHLCDREQATNIGVLLGRLYDLAAKLIPAWDGE